MWDLAQGLIYLMSYLLDPIVFAFKFKPLENRQLNRFSQFVTYMLIVDIFVTFFTGVPKEDQDIPDQHHKTKKRHKKRRDNTRSLQIRRNISHTQDSKHLNKRKKALDDPNLHRDIWFLTKRYLKGDFFLDFLANFPSLVYTMYQGGYDPNKDFEALYETDLKFTIFMALKVLRLCHLDEV